MLNKIRNIDADTVTPYISTAAVLLILSAFFFPAIAVMFIQDMLFFSYDHWSFLRPSEAYIGFGAAMIWVAIVLLSFLFTKMHSERKDTIYKFAGLHVVMMALAVPVFALSIYHYVFLDENGVTGNSFWTFSEEHISWDEVEEVTRLVDESNKAVLSYTFSDGEKSITVPYNSREYETRRAILSAVQMYEWEVTDIFEDAGTVPITF
ncbi:hypothetical protein [Jeotgalibacillus haloalkalitolerans]|uniref:Uncharacterized protein n=1 Tax=Jeotgalibacillus haloalkalitolerans TaxID=3104292 RepID=A0ABU5KHI3_9BACL|nr:hypothetical protein [Jeotgalibacillus sp. HH7-29]MDZ5710635.1 hypothetical protein [Jeotgalibacillus sp. HH7-29]